MLRNRGVNVTERRIRHDVMRAYEYDIFDVKPRWRCLHEAGCQSNFYRQPRYCTTRCTKPMYFQTPRSSVSSYGVKRVYLPDEEWGAGSAESVYFRHPRYSTGSCYPNEAYHISGAERPYRRDLRYEGYYSRGLSPMCFDDDDYYLRKPSRYTDKRLARKVTRKLSPIFTCDCATTSNVRQLKKNNKNDIDNKVHHNDLSKEAKELSRDVFKIISVLQKADGEYEEQFSSASLLQNIHNLDCRSSNSFAKLITQRVNVCSKMEKQKQDDPLTRFKAASGVRSKLEALVEALKHYEAEKYLNRDSSNYDDVPKYKNVIPSDPPSVEMRSFFNGKDLKSSTIIYGGKQKDIVLQTEQPKTSNKSVCGKVKLKKGESSAEKKSLRSRISWRKKEGSGIKMRRDSANERLADKKTERKRSFFSKTKSKSKIKSIIESEQFQSGKIDVAKQGQTTNKAGLMIQIGGNSQRRKPTSPEKYKEKKPKPWIKKFVEEKLDTKNNIRVRWNNKAFYTKSSSTIIELVHNVYKQMGIKNNSKSDEISTSKHKKPPKTTTHKHSTTRMLKSPKKPKYKQKLAAYMMPQIIVPGPFYTQNATNKDTEKISKSPEKSYLNEYTPKFYNGVNITNELGTNYFEILLPEDFIDPISTREELTTNKEYTIIEYQPTIFDVFEETLIDNLNGMDVDQVDLKESVSFEVIEHEHVNVVQMSSNSLCSRKRCEDSEANVIGNEPESESTESTIDIQDLSAEETESQFFARSFCSLAEKFIQTECLHWMPMNSESFQWAVNCEELDEVKTKSVLRQITSSIHDDISIKTDTNITIESINDGDTQNNATNKVALKDSNEVYIRTKSSASNNNLVQRKKQTTGTFSDSIVGIISRKSLVMSVLWSLFKILRKDHSLESNQGPPPQDLSLVEPPGTVSQPDCSHKSQKMYLPRRPLAQKQKITFEPLRLAQLAFATLQVKEEVAQVNLSLNSIQFEDVVNDEVEIEKSETTEESDAVTLDEPSGPIDVIETVQATVPDERNVELDISPTPCKPSCHIRLVRSLTNLQTDRDIQPKAIRSALILQNQKYQNKSLLLLYVRSVLYGHSGTEQTLSEEEPQLPSLTQCFSESTEYELQNLQLESVDRNKEPDESVNNSQDIISSENSADIVVQKLPSNNADPVEGLSKQEENLNEVNNFEKRECQNTRNEKKKNKYLGYVKRMSKEKIENYTFPLDTPCILDKNAAEQFSVEVTKGDKITKILIRNHKSNKKDNLKSADLKISQGLVVTNNTKPIKRSAKKNVRVCINISNINAKEAENGKTLLNKSESNQVFDDQLSKEKADERQMAVTECTDINYTTDDTAGIQRYSVYKSRSLQPFTESLQNDDMSGTNIQHDITKSPSERRLSTNEFNNFYTADVSPTDSYLYEIAAEEYVNEILGSADIIDRTKLKRVVEMRALNNMMLLNLSAFAEMAFKRELSSDHTDTYTTLRQQLKRRKKIVSILSEINMRNITDYFGEQAKTSNADSSDDLQSSVTCSLCNMFERELLSHRVKANMPTNFNVKTKRNIGANYYIPHSVSPFTQRCLELEELLRSLKEERNSSSDTFLDIDDRRIGAIIKKNMLRSKRNATGKIESKPICWYCVKNINKKSKKNQKKSQTRKHANRYIYSCQNDDMILPYTDSSKSQNSSLMEYKRCLKNDRLNRDGSVQKMYNEGDNEDILQSCKIKKAVLQLYNNKAAVNEGYIVAKMPKYLRL